MPAPITFKEPVSCEYLYVDDDNRVHLMLPIVGGDEIGLDNTCKTALELRRFFFGSGSAQSRKKNVYKPAVDILIEYMDALTSDIDVLLACDYSAEDKERMIAKKDERWQQIDQYIELVNAVADDANIRNSFHPDIKYPLLPKGINTILADAKNAFAIRLAPLEEDPATRIKSPLFSVRRTPQSASAEYQLTTGLGFQLRTGFTPQGDPIAIKKLSPQDIVIDMVIAKVLNKIGENRKVREAIVDERLTADDALLIDFDALKLAIAEELRKIDVNDANITDDNKRLKIDVDNRNLLIDYEYARDNLACDSKTPISEWINGLISARITDASFWSLIPGSAFCDIPGYCLTEDGADSFWGLMPGSVFYDIPDHCLTEAGADSLSLKVQFFLGEINGYCKTHQLSSFNFGEFFDQELNGKALAEKVKQGLIDGESIESLIFDTINQSHTLLGLTSPLTIEQQKHITQIFTAHYSIIKNSPHFDEFLIANPDLPGSLYSHRGKMCVHFFEFYLHQYPLRSSPLEAYMSTVLSEFRPISNRLSNKNISLIRAMPCILDLMQQLGEPAGVFLERLLSAHQTHGFTMHSLLTDEQRQTICAHYQWTSIEEQIVESNTRCKDYWSSVSTKPLVQDELSAISDGLSDIVARYKKNRSLFFIPKKARKEQCSRLLALAKEIKRLKENALSDTEILSQILKAIHVLDQLAAEISVEDNSHPSQLLKEITQAKVGLIEYCKIKSSTPLATDVSAACHQQKEMRLNSITSPEIRALVESLPAHCQTRHAIALFNTLSLAEAHQIATFLQLKYVSSRYHRETSDADFPRLVRGIQEARAGTGSLDSADKPRKVGNQVLPCDIERILKSQPFREHVDKIALLQDVAETFKQANQQQLEAFKQAGKLSDKQYEKLQRLAPHLRPDLLREEQLPVWISSLEDEPNGERLAWLNCVPKDAFSRLHVAGVNHPDFLESVADASDASAVQEIMTAFGQERLNHQQKCIDESAQLPLAVADMLSSTQSPITHAEEAERNVVSRIALLRSSLQRLHKSLAALVDSSATTKGNSIINRVIHHAPVPFFFPEEKQEKFTTYLRRYQEEMTTIQETLGAIASDFSETQVALTDEERQEVMASLSQFEDRFKKAIVAPIEKAKVDRLTTQLSQCKACLTSLEEMLKPEAPSKRPSVSPRR